MIHSIRLLREKIEERIASLEADLGRGVAFDYPQYKLIVGQVVGLRTCLDLCDQIEGDIDERRNSGTGD